MLIENIIQSDTRIKFNPFFKVLKYFKVVFPGYSSLYTCSLTFFGDLFQIIPMRRITGKSAEIYYPYDFNSCNLYTVL